MIKKLLQLLIMIFSISVQSCEDDYYDEPIPEFPVDFEINVNDPVYFNLHTLNYVYLDGIGWGVRGIILYKRGNDQYVAFERTCSFQPNNPCATVDVDPSGQYMVDACCGSIFSFTGDPMGGPAYRPLLQYQTSLNGSYLRIYNNL